MTFGARRCLWQIMQFLAPVHLHVVTHTLEVVSQMDREIRGLEEPVRGEDDGEIRGPDRLPKRKAYEKTERSE